MKKYLLSSLFVTALVGTMGMASIASTPEVYIDDQFDSFNTAEWANVSNGGGTVVVANGQLTCTANGYYNGGAVKSVDAVHPDAGQTVLLSANIVYTTDSQWDQDKIFGFTSGDNYAGGGAGVYLKKVFTDNGRQWRLFMDDGVNGTQSYYVPYGANGSLNDWWYMAGPMKLTWSADKVVWEKFDPWTNGGVYYTVFDSSVNGPLEGGTWRIPTADSKVLMSALVNSDKLIVDSLKLEVLPAPAVPEPSSLLALGCGLTGLLGAIRRRK